MALVPYLDAEQLPEKYRHLLHRPINLFRALANSPEALDPFRAFAEWIRWDCQLDSRLRELLILQIGYLTSDEYEWSHHVVLSAKFGVTDEDIERLIAFSNGEETSLSATDTLILKAATEITNDSSLSDATWNQLSAVFDNGRLTDIVVVASFYNMVVRVLGGLRIEVEPGYRQGLERFPLPTTLHDRAPANI